MSVGFACLLRFELKTQISQASSGQHQLFDPLRACQSRNVGMPDQAAPGPGPGRMLGPDPSQGLPPRCWHLRHCCHSFKCCRLHSGLISPGCPKPFSIARPALDKMNAVFAGLKPHLRPHTALLGPADGCPAARSFLRKRGHSIPCMPLDARGNPCESWQAD